MIISSIAAVAKNGVIGRNNEIPWYLPADLRYFKKTTLSHAVIMGRKSFVSIGRPLPKRTNIVITRDPFFIASNVLIAHSIPEALELALDQAKTEVFIIGGGNVYAQSIDLWQRLYLTEVDLEPEGDVFFPEIDADQWRLTWEEAHEADDKNAHAYTFKIYERQGH